MTTGRSRRNTLVHFAVAARRSAPPRHLRPGRGHRGRSQLPTGRLGRSRSAGLCDHGGRILGPSPHPCGRRELTEAVVSKQRAPDGGEQRGSDAFGMTASPLAPGRVGDGGSDAFGVTAATLVPGRVGDGDTDTSGVTAAPTQGRVEDGDAGAIDVTAARAEGRGGEGRLPPDRSGLAERPLVIVGPTASGKSDLALSLARLIGGAEIVTLDSMQVYRGMDIGTATPTPAEQAEVPHHLIDLVDPSEEFTVAEVQARAWAVIDGIRDRGAVPVLVGGTGLYVRAVIDRLRIPGRYLAVRAEVETESDTAALHRRLASRRSGRRRPHGAVQSAQGRQSPRSHHRQRPAVLVVRTRPGALPDHTVRAGGPSLGSGPPRCPHRGPLRASQISDGFLDEVRALSVRPMSRHRVPGPWATRNCSAMCRDETTLDEALDLAVVRTRRFARRQERWFRRDPRIGWLDAPTSPANILCTWHAAVS